MDPFVFVGILFVDHNRMIDPKFIAAAYILLVVNRTFQYVSFLKSMADQICDYCELPFLVVKQGWTPPKKAKKIE